MAQRLRVGGALVLSLYILVPTAGAAENDPVARAIDRGVEGLKKIQGNPADGFAKRQHLRCQALVGLTLLECGVKPDDPVIKGIAESLRQECLELTHTYRLSLSIMFFDKLGDPNDEPLIQSMGVRLLGGQSPESGGWSYNSDSPSTAELRRLKDLVRDNNSPGIQENNKPEESLFKQPPPLPKELKEEVERIQKGKPQPNIGKNDDRGFLGAGDNSNTQFAILGLWVAGRHGVPIEKAMAKVDARFRNSQNFDGGWSYQYAPSNRHADTSTGAMTCAGLLGLAMSHGAANQAVLRTDPKTPANKLPRDPSRDPNVRTGLMALGTSLGQPVDMRGKHGRMPGMRKGYYFLWSVERVGVAYGLTTIGNKDWYAWGSQLLVASQGEEGLWDGEHGAEVDTCFALLFLRRVNLAKDLTASLRGVKDPGEVKLTAGGVGGEELLAKNLISGIVMLDDPKAKPDDLKAKPDDRKADPETSKLTDELIQAPAAQQEPLITKLKDGKGTPYTDALASAIPQLSGSTKTKARDALAERLARMKATTLRDKMQDEAAEVRRAAAVACYMKEEKSLTPELIGLLEDKDPGVARAAQAALKEMTKQDFGPSTGASAEERAKAVAAWKAWWEKKGSK